MLASAAALAHEFAEKTTVTTIELLLLIVTIPLLITALVALSNLFFLRSIDSYKTGGGTPFVSILVPARNEEEVIAKCVESLLAQEYLDFELIVLDDNSTDSTLQILFHLAATNSRLRVIKGTPLPEGWLGKPWACHQLSQKARGEILLFTDADTVHRPQMLIHAVSALNAERADFISALPRQTMLSPLEKLVMPFSYWSIMSFLPLGIAYRTCFSILSSATGQFMLFRRAAYDQIGGFASIRDNVVDDVELCKRVRTQGLCWRLLDGKTIYQVHQYKSPRELYEGHTKNLFAGFSHNILAFSLFWLWLLLACWLPPICLARSFSNPVTVLILWSSSAAIGFALMSWIITYVRFGFPVYCAFLYPITALLMVYMASRSLLLTLSGKATWKERYIPVKT